MKRFLLGVLFVGFIGISSAFTVTNFNNEKAEVNVVACKHGQCQATAKSTKKRCKHCVSQSGDKYCWQHK